MISLLLLMASLPVTSSLTSSLRSPQLLKRESMSLLERLSLILLLTLPRMSSSSSMPHGADTARSLPPSGTRSLKSSRVLRTLSSQSSMLPPTRLMVLRFNPTLLLPSIPRTTRSEFPMKVAESSMTSRNGSRRTHPLSRLLRAKLKTSDLLLSRTIDF